MYGRPYAHGHPSARSAAPPGRPLSPAAARLSLLSYLAGECIGLKTWHPSTKNIQAIRSSRSPASSVAERSLREYEITTFGRTRAKPNAGWPCSSCSSLAARETLAFSLPSVRQVNPGNASTRARAGPCLDVFLVKGPDKQNAYGKYIFVYNSVHFSEVEIVGGQYPVLNEYRMKINCLQPSTQF